MNVESFISVMNKLHDILNTVGSHTIELPQIVAIGSQSSGKSSVLENLVGRDFLPRGTGAVTRCPLILQLINVPKDASDFKENNKTPVAEYGKFLHTGNKLFYDFKEIRQEIDAEMERKSGPKNGISAETINLKIFSPNVINLTLVDLPGVVKVPIGDQPKDIEMQIRELILQYIRNPNAIILAITAANTDFATSESIKLARECDPEGKRTLAVITKLDLMDAGTNATDALCGRIIPVKLGIIGVVNRSQQDIINDKSINDAIKDEAEFLQKNYPALASINGTEFLRKTLNKLLVNHIRDCLPHLKAKINAMKSQYQSLLHSHGNIITDQNGILLQILTKFSSSYCASIAGTAKNIETSELSGGARICYIFHEIFRRAVTEIDPLSGLSYWDILTAIRNATGTRPAFFVPEVAFELLVKRQIQTLEEPSLRCVELVHEEMQRIVRHCGKEFQQDIRRFPKLHEKIIDVTTQLLQRRLLPTNTMVEHLIGIELAYINTKHPDFYHASSTFHGNNNNASTKLHSYNSNSGADIFVNTISKDKPVSEREISQPFDIIYEAKQDINLFPGPSSESRSNYLSLEEGGENKIQNSAVNYGGNWLNRFSKALSMGELTDEQYDPQVKSVCLSPNRSYSCNYTRNLTAVERKECEIIEHLIRSYFAIVKKNIQDAVPKAIMHFLVNHVRDNLQSELVTHLYKPENFANLLQESEDIINGRKEATEMLKVLEKSSQIISEVRDITL